MTWQWPDLTLPARHNTTKGISAKAPADDAPSYSADLLAKQVVVLDEINSAPEGFEKFVVQRRELIAAKLNERLGTSGAT